MSDVNVIGVGMTNFTKPGENLFATDGRRYQLAPGCVR